jgi:hypothetical protein
MEPGDHRPGSYVRVGQQRLGILTLGHRQHVAEPQVVLGEAVGLAAEAFK